MQCVYFYLVWHIWKL